MAAPEALGTTEQPDADAADHAFSFPCAARYRPTASRTRPESVAPLSFAKSSSLALKSADKPTFIRLLMGPLYPNVPICQSGSCQLHFNRMRPIVHAHANPAGLLLGCNCTLTNPAAQRSLPTLAPNWGRVVMRWRREQSALAAAGLGAELAVLAVAIP